MNQFFSFFRLNILLFSLAWEGNRLRVLINEKFVSGKNKIMSKSSCVLFYSNHCHHCKVLLQELRQTPLFNQVNLSCVDTLPRQNLPTFLKSVPTLVVSPPLQVLTGDDVFRWYNQQVYELKEQRQAAQANVNQIVPQTTNNMTAPPPAEPSAWHTAEMGSTFSDSYSMIGTDYNTQGSGGNSIAHSFAFIHGSPNGQQQQQQQQFSKMGSGGGGGANDRQSKKMDELNMKMERLKAERDRQNTQVNGAGMMGRF